MTKNEWTVEFDNRYLYSNNIVTITRPAALDMKSFINTLLSEAKEAGRREENKEWREGKRCENCGEPIDPSELNKMCDDCWIDG